MYPNFISLDRRKIVLSGGIPYMTHILSIFLDFKLLLGSVLSETPCSAVVERVFKFSSFMVS